MKGIAKLIHHWADGIPRCIKPHPEGDLSLNELKEKIKGWLLFLQEIGAVLIATDGPHSTVRSPLVGKEAAKVTPIDYASTVCFTRHTRKHALFLRARPHHPLYQVHLTRMATVPG
ncbi:hypothetical protein Asppvi_009276 [Aspergillus pseudoviridinutans]|uniref:Uncharacterized protein n=1 Tax=Aspergillus pseudoviridinutans TaxID=1517512 RepID=A0A9P3EYA3_9EURO|nr:uncharacterized protein Asppvi_009276 [Aspergillus pseudoviridinutans]GIJ90322.1 hypothetical protein Asppvi_009276 [Aspergillus pseudoviridinutans]